MRRGRLPGWLAAVAITLPLACGDMRQDELDCEEAVSHLQECCPGFTGNNVECTYVSGCAGTTYPEISYDQSRCIRGESCDALVRSGVCERTRQLSPEPTGRGATTFFPQVCP